jgi:phytoene/squalene synthetase
VDDRRGRVYLPQSELARHGVTDGDVGHDPLPSGVRAALHAAVQRTRQLFSAGRPLCDHVSGRLRFELRATWLGGMRILDRVEAQLSAPEWQRPALGAGDLTWVAWRTATWAATDVAPGAAS